MKLAYQTMTWGGGVVGHPAGVTSIKDLFYLSPRSTEPALRDIAAAGYAGCELFDGNLMEHADAPVGLGQLLDDRGLQLVAVYCGANLIFDQILGEELWRFEHAARLAAELGAEHLVIGGGAKPAQGSTTADFDKLAAGLAAAEDVARRHCLTPSYHPHLGTLVETPEALEQIMARTDIGLCPDTAHLAAGGGDPAAIIRRYGDRIAYVHLKDWDSTECRFTPLGDGDLALDDIIAALQQIAYTGWVTVELDEYDGDAGDAAARSAAYLRSRLA
jgi:inosose dehydratase